MRERLVLDVLDVIVMDDKRRITGKTARTADVIGEILCRMKRADGGSSGRTIINCDPGFIEWATEGIKAEVISADANGWLKGKVRLCLEFIPDPEPEPEPEEILIPKEPESPLNEFRQKEVESQENAQLKQLESLLDKIRQPN